VAETVEFPLFSGRPAAIPETDMYAVFRTGGKQYRAVKGDTLKIEKLSAAEGDDVEFDEVLMVGDGDNLKVGTPLVTGSKVKAKVLAQARDRKIDVIKFRRRQNYRRTQGHRQAFTLVEVTGITGAPRKTSAAAEE
jgi:large subunit ribosomal protein L21